MRLTTSFKVELPVGEVWSLLQDIESVAGWFPGARLETVEGESYKGTVRVKLGPMVVDYRGAARFIERDEVAHRVVLEASGREQRGTGTAKATATTRLAGHDGGTDVDVSIDLEVTGRPAQLGQGLIQEVAQRLVGEFSSRMAAGLTQKAEHEALARAAVPQDDPATDVLDLGQLAGSAVVRRLVPAVAAVTVLILVWRYLRRRWR